MTQRCIIKFMTSVKYFSVRLNLPSTMQNLDDLYGKINLSDGIKCVKYAGSNGNCKHKCILKEHKCILKEYKKRKMEKTFFNCIVIKFRYQDVRISCKLFKNGTMTLNCWVNAHGLDCDDIVRMVLKSLKLMCTYDQKKIFTNEEIWKSNVDFDLGKLNEIAKYVSTNHDQQSYCVKIHNTRITKDLITIDNDSWLNDNILIMRVLTELLGYSPIFINNDMMGNNIMDDDMENPIIEIEI